MQTCANVACCLRQVLLVQRNTWATLEMTLSVWSILCKIPLVHNWKEFPHFAHPAYQSSSRLLPGERTWGKGARIQQGGPCPYQFQKNTIQFQHVFEGTACHHNLAIKMIPILNFQCISVKHCILMWKELSAILFYNFMWPFQTSPWAMFIHVYPLWCQHLDPLSPFSPFLFFVSHLNMQPKIHTVFPTMWWTPSPERQQKQPNSNLKPSRSMQDMEIRCFTSFAKQLKAVRAGATLPSRPTPPFTTSTWPM